MGGMKVGRQVERKVRKEVGTEVNQVGRNVERERGKERGMGGRDADRKLGREGRRYGWQGGR